MKSCKFPMNNWILAKVVSHLSEHEGCEVISVKDTLEGQEACIQDAFGFRYNIEIKAVARVDASSISATAMFKTPTLVIE